MSDTLKYHFKDIVRVTHGFYKDWKGTVWSLGEPVMGAYSLENQYVVDLLVEDEKGELVDAGKRETFTEKNLEMFKPHYDPLLGSYERVTVWGSCAWLPDGKIEEKGQEVWSVPRTARGIDTWCHRHENFISSRSRISQESANLAVKLDFKDWQKEQKKAK